MMTTQRSKSLASSYFSMLIQLFWDHSGLNNLNELTHMYVYTRYTYTVLYIYYMWCILVDLDPLRCDRDHKQSDNYQFYSAMRSGSRLPTSVYNLVASLGTAV